MMQPPKILQVIPTLQTGGAERTALDIGDALVQHGWTSLVASQGGRLLEQLERGGSRHITLPLKSKNPVTIWRNADRLSKLIKQEGIALIHARSRAPAWSALLAARRTGIPFVTTYHGSYNQKSWLKGQYNSVMARADVVIANSNWTRDLIVARNPWARDRIQVVHRGTDLDRFKLTALAEERLDALRHSWGIEKQHTIVLQLARLNPGKGQEFLVDASIKIAHAHPDMRTVLVGDSIRSADYKARLQEKIAAHDLQDRILMPGHCDDPAAAMALADIVVGATIQPEAFGRTAVEAGALERPVIVSDIGAVGETVLAEKDVGCDAMTGWKIPAGDAAALAEALRQALAMPKGERSEMGRRARAHAEQYFSLPMMCGKTIAIYETLLAEIDHFQSPNQ